MTGMRPEVPSTTADAPSAPDTEPSAAEGDPNEADAPLDPEPADIGTADNEADARLDPEPADIGTADRELDTGRPASGWAHLRLGEPVVAAPLSARDSAACEDAVDQPVFTGARVDVRWREIQAGFVDDPRDSVERALRAVDDEVTAVIDALRRRQDALAPMAPGQTSARPAADDPGGPAASPNPGDTERLRVALRDCRAFWTELADLGDRLG